MRTHIARLLFTILISTACVIIPSQISLGEPDTTTAPLNTSSVDCNLTPNPSDCFWQQSQTNWQQGSIQNLPLNTQSLGLYGPFSATMTYDNDLGWILGLSYVEMLNERFGVAMKGSIGKNEWRGNLTAGYAINDKHQVKLTYEYLTQNLPFDFASGTVNSWVAQHALGGAYQYLLREGMIHSLELSGSYAKAQGKNLDEVVFYQGDDPYLNKRRIAPGQEATGLAKINLLPFINTSVTLGGGYSQVQYNTRYENNQNNAAFAYVTEIEHIFHPTFKLTTSVNNSASNTNYTAKVSKLLPKNFEVSVSGQHQNSRGNLPNASSVMLGVTYPAPKAYAMNKFSSGLTELKNWIEKPVVYYTRVLAVKDELVQKYSLSSQPIPSQTKYISQSIDSVNTKDYFQFDPTLYDQVQFTMVISPSGKPGVNFAGQLGIVLAQTNLYEALVSSAQPIPGGQDLEGDYNITITATGMKKGLNQPLVDSRTFGLTVLYTGPVWSNKNLPDTTVGMNYPEVDLAQNSGTDNGYVTTADLPNDTYTFSLVDGPSWLTVKDQHILVATGPTPVTTNNSVSVKLSVTSQTLHQSAEKVFQVQVKAGAPVWNGNLPDGQYDIVYPTVDLKNYVTTPGASSDQYTFTLSGQPSWLELSSDGQSLIGNGPIPENQGNVVTFSITAKSSTSEISTTQQFTLHIQPGNPKWTENMLPDAEYGQTYGAIDLAAFLYTPGLANDSYRISLGNDAPSWLTINDDHTLVGTAPVPDTQTSPVSITIQAVSKQTGLAAAPQVFTLVIADRGAPIWTKTELPDAQYGTVYTSTDLNSYVYTPGLTETYTYALKDLPSWLKVTNGHILEGTGNIPNDAPDVLQISATVTGNTSQKSTAAVLAVKVRPGAPVWSGNLPAAQYNQAYAGVDLLPMVQTPGVQGDSYVFKVDSAPAWLKLGADGHSLVANGSVPENVDSPVAVKLTATSNASQLSTSQDFTIIINPGAPVWTNNNLPDAQFGLTYEAVDLSPLVHTPGLTNDSFTMELAPGSPAWLQIGQDGHSLVGVSPVPSNQPTPVQITIKATSTGTNLSASQTFTINVTPQGAPIWIKTELPDGQYNAPYTPVDLTTYVDTPTIDLETYQFKIVDAPSWLTLGSDGHTLQATGPIPENSPNTVQLQINVTGTKSQQTTLGTLTLRLQPGAPIWSGELPTAQYEVAYDGADLLPMVRTPGEVADHYTFTLDSSAPAWVKLGSDGHSLVANGVVPANESSPVSVKITAKSDASGLSTTEDFSVTINPGVPIWINDNLPDAQYGSTYGAVDLAPMLYTPGLPNDTYKMELAPGSPSWLNIVNDHVLTGVDITPDDEKTPLQITIKATSKTGLSSDQTFVLVITPRSAPIWTNTQLPDATYGEVCNPIDLNTYVATPGQSDTYTFEVTQTPPWLTLDSDGHTLICTGAVPESADNDQQVSVTVTGVNAKQSTPGVLSLHILPGAPVWSGGLPDAQYNASYVGTDLLPMVHTPGEVSDNYTFNLDANAPSWLKLDGHSLVANGVVPETENSPVSVKISVTSAASQKTTAQVFNVNINPGNPVWSGNLPDGGYGTIYPKIDLSPMVHTPGLPSDSYQMQLAAGAPSWLTIDPSDQHTLMGTAPIPDNESTPVTITITAVSQGTANKLSTSQTFTFGLVQGLAWSNATPIPATAGDSTYSYNLNELVTCPVGDQCPLVVSNLPAWLKIQTNPDGSVWLANTQPVPAASEDQNGSVSFNVEASSKNTNQVLPTKTFTIPITNVLPEWQQTTIPGVFYDGASTDGNDPDQTVHLNDYITDKTNAGLNFLPGPNFDSSKWRIANPAGTNDYYLVKLAPGDISEIGTQMKVSVLAKNNTSVDGKSNDVLVNILPNNGLSPPTWNTTTLPAANMGAVYGGSSAVVDLNTMVSTQNVSGDSYQFSFDDKTLPHPAWLDSAQITETGHLTSTGNVPVDAGTACSAGGPYDVCFSVAILATSKASGKSQSYTFKDIAILQALPIWSATPPVAYDKWTIAYDDTDKGIELDQFITSGENNLTFSLAQPQANWSIVPDGGKHYLRRTTSAGQLPDDINTTVSLRIVASNSTSTPANQNANAYKDVKITVGPDSSLLPPVWEQETLPNADMGYNYPKTGSIDLASMVSTPEVSGDKFTFTFDDTDKNIGAHPAWLIIQNGQLINDPAANNNEVPKTATSPFAVRIVATSVASGVSTAYTFSNIQVNQIPPVWQDVQSSQIRFDDTTSSIPPSGTTLKNWIQSGTDKNVVFSFNTSGQSTCSLNNFIGANWVIPTSSPANIFRSAAGQTNPADVWDGTDDTLVSIPVLASNDTSVTPVEACLSVKVSPDTSMPAPAWLNGSFPAIYGGEPGLYQYQVDLSQYINDGSNKEFTCKIGENSANWLMLNTQNMGQLINDPAVNGGGVPPTDDKPQITLNCQSKASAQWTGAKTFTLDVAPVLKQAGDASIPSQIKFDDIDTGINAYDFLISGRKGVVLSIKGADSSYIANNWTVANSQYLRRKPVNTNQIDASDLTGSIQGKVKINVEVSNSTSTIKAARDGMVISLLPDPNLSYRFSGSITSPLAVVEPIGNTQGLLQTGVTVDSSNTHGFYMQNADTPYQIINDTNFAYSDPGNQPNYIYYNTPPKIGIGFPGISVWGQTTFWSVNVKTTANGGGPSGHGVATSMPELGFADLILVPPITPSTSGIMVYGHSYWSTGVTKWYYGYLQMQLSPNTIYYVKQVKPSSKGNNANWAQICLGRETQPPSSTTCSNGKSSINLNNQAQFTTDPTGVVTFVLSAVYNTTGSGEYPFFIPDGSNPGGSAGNIRLRLYTP